MSNKNHKKHEHIITELLEFIGEDSTRSGLLDTPNRVLKSYKEMTSGYEVNITEIMSRVFDSESDSDEIVTVKRIPFVSLCEHHMLPFTGTVDIGYIPNPDIGILGLSKFARLVDAYARRLQVQERLTTQIANSIYTHLSPIGVGVVITASHSCMSIRGIKSIGSVTTTSKMIGCFREKVEARQELLELFKV